MSTLPNLLRFLSVGIFLFLSPYAGAQTFTWDPDGNQVNDGGAGTWDVGTTTNWDDNGSAPNVDWTNGNNAIFGSGSYQVDLTSAGVTVGDLTYGGGGTLEFKGSTASGSPGDAITINSGGATWDTGGGEIEFFNDGNNNNTRLSMTTGDTLTVAGGGTFDTGQNPQTSANGTWTVSGATLDVTSATTVRGDITTIGQFGTVKLAGGSTFIHERNVDRTYSNDWELGAGTVTFDNRWARNYNMTGDITGAGGMKVDALGNRHLVLSGNNTFTGGIEVSDTSRLTVDSGSIGTGDITLSGSTATNGGILRLLGGVNMGSRDLVLNGFGGTIVNAGANSLDGNITGSGGLTIGSAAFSGNTNVLTLNGTADHTGDTTIFKGSISLGANNALSSASVLNIGGSSGGTSQLTMNGFDAEIAGLKNTSGSSNTRLINNNAASVLTINVASGESHVYSGNINGTAGTTSIVKTGAGTQTFIRSAGTAGFSAAVGTIAVNDGGLVWDVVGSGAATVGANGILMGRGTFGDDVNVSGNLTPGTLAGSLSTMTFESNLTLQSTANLNIGIASLSDFDVLDFDQLSGGTGILAANGTLNLSSTGYTPMAMDVFQVFSDWNGLSGSFHTITGTDLGGGYSFDTSNLLVNGQISVIFAAVPEPSSAMLLLAGLGLCGARRRRTRKVS